MKVDEGTFTLSANDEQKAFQVRVFKFFSPRSAKSKVSLVAHRREVTDNALQAYVPEFAEEFYEPGRSEEHTSELQSIMRISYAVFCLNNKNYTDCITQHEHRTNN